MYLFKSSVWSVLAVWAIVNSWAGTAMATEDVSGDWRCLHQNGEYTASRGMYIIGNKLIETSDFGARRIIPNVVIFPDFVFWNGSDLQEFEFNPQIMKLVETTRLSVKSQATILEYKCEKQ